MPISDWIVMAPAIVPLRHGRPGETLNQIYCDTNVRLETETPNCRIYFTTDGSDPDVFGETHSGRQSTNKYKGPFKLHPGRRTIKAMAVTRDGQMISSVSTKTFQVMEPRPYREDAMTAISSETELDSFTLNEIALGKIQRYPPKPSHSLDDYARSTEPAFDVDRKYAASLDYDLDTYRIPSSRVTSSDSYRRSSRSRSRSGHRARSRSLSPLRSSRIGADFDLDSYFDAGISDHGSSRRGLPKWDSRYGSDDSDNETYVSNFFRSRRVPENTDRDYFAETEITPRVHFGHDTRHMYSSPRYADSAMDDLLHHHSNHKRTERKIPRREAVPDDSHLAYQLGYDVLDPKQFSFDSGKVEEKKRGEKDLNEYTEKGYHMGFDLAAKHLSDTEDDWMSTARSKSTEGGRRSRRELHEEKMKDEREKKEKKKKKAKESSSDSSSSSSSSFTSLSLSELDEGKKAKKDSKKKDVKEGKKKAKAKEEEKEQENEDQEKEKELLVKDKDSEEEKKLVTKSVKEKKNREGGTQTTPRFPEAENLKKKPCEDSRLSFINDSGTQINFWGLESDEAVEKLTQVMGGKKAGEKVASKSSKRGAKQAMVQKSAPSVEAQAQISAHSAPVTEPPKTVQREEQKDVESIGKFFKKLFSGWGSSGKEKSDPRSTVREIDGDSKGKMTYDEIVAKCKQEDRWWEDPDFPAEDSSVYYENNPVSRGRIEWKRPHEICKDPQLFVGGASRFDIKQGVLGNCWLLAALSAVCGNKKLLNKIIPPDQSFEDPEYAGIFRFRFWQYGNWVEVCIDDRLPTQNGELIFLHSEKRNEFWSPLLEKAYAKICGSYETLSGGLASEGMTDFTGGVCERFNFKEEVPPKMYQIMLKANQRSSLMSCSIDASPNQIEAELSNGLIMGHAYTITDVKTVRTPKGEVELVRVRNPWGNEAEWNGAWSDKSKEWKSIPDDVKKSLGLTFDHDGEFWMSYKDFEANFQRVEICNLGPDALMDEGDDSIGWSLSVLKGAWRRNTNAGGCRNFPKTYHTNPQYHIQVRDVDDDEDDLGTVVVGLMQKGRRRLRAIGQGNWTIGYDIYSKGNGQCNDNLDRKFFDRHNPVTSSPSYINMREVCGRHKLPPGDYCLIPTTFESNEEGDFVVRVFSEKETGVSEIDTGSALVQAKPMQMVQSAPVQRVADSAVKLFEKYGGEDKEVDAYELGAILNATFAQEFKFGEFDLNICRSLVAAKDMDRTGKLSLEEFKSLWDEMQKWKVVYKQFDQDQSGHFSSFELRDALKSMGFQVSNGTFSSLIAKYANREGFIEFDDFVSCVLNLTTIFGAYQAKSTEGTAGFTLDELLQLMI